MGAEWLLVGMAGLVLFFAWRLYANAVQWYLGNGDSERSAESTGGLIISSFVLGVLVFNAMELHGAGSKILGLLLGLISVGAFISSLEQLDALARRTADEKKAEKRAAAAMRAS